MKAWFGAIALLAAACIGFEHALAGWLHITLPQAMAGASWTTKLAFLMLSLTFIATVVLGLVHLAIGRRSGMGQLLAVLSWLAPLFGALAATFAGLLIVIVVQRVHTHNFRVVGPSVVEALLPLAQGLLVGAVAAGAAAFARAPRRHAAT